MNVEVPEYEILERVEVDPESTVLLVVHMQNDFVRPDGKLPVESAAATIEPIQRLQKLAWSGGLPIVYTQDTHWPGHPEFPIWGEHVVDGSEGWEIVDELQPRPDRGDRVLRTGYYDTFRESYLHEALKRAGAETIILTGTMSNICVLYTAAGAAMRHYDLVVPIDTISALNEFDQQAAIRQMAFVFQAKITRAESITSGG